MLPYMNSRHVLFWLRGLEIGLECSMHAPPVLSEAVQSIAMAVARPKAKNGNRSFAKTYDTRAKARQKLVGQRRQWDGPIASVR